MYNSDYTYYYYLFCR